LAGTLGVRLTEALVADKAPPGWRAGGALCERLLDLDWIERLPGTRAVRLSNIGRRTLRRDFGVVVN
jgi:hypothetical protein